MKTTIELYFHGHSSLNVLSHTEEKNLVGYRATGFKNTEILVYAA